MQTSHDQQSSTIYHPPTAKVANKVFLHLLTGRDPLLKSFCSALLAFENCLHYDFDFASYHRRLRKKHYSKTQQQSFSYNTALLWWAFTA